MMRISKVYTRSGDGGTTRLADGTEVQKDSLRVVAYGEIDELASVIGIVLSGSLDDTVRETLVHLQHLLFNLGGQIASAGQHEGLIQAVDVRVLEAEIDRLNENLPPLKEFVLPGGTPSAAMLHLARTVCRRAERTLVSLSRESTIAPETIHFLNRLSDLLFVMARYENRRDGNREVTWKNPVQ